MHPLIHRNALADLLARTTARYPDKLALVWGTQRETYAQLNAAVNRCANAIAAHGVVKGERIAMLSHNHREFVIAHIALARLGAITVPINFMLKAPEVAYVLGHSGATGLIAEAALVGVAEDAVKQVTPVPTLKLRGVIAEPGAVMPAGWEAVASWIAHADERAPQVDIDDNDCMQILYTSGTESRPKGAMLTSRVLIAEYVSCIIDGDYREDDIEVHPLPLYHSAQLDCFLWPDLMLGATNIVLPGADPTLIMEAVEREHATKLFCPPTVWIGLLRHPDFDKHDLSSLRKGYYGASIMPRPVIEELSKRLPKMALYNYYGQTEIAPLATVLKPADQLRKLGSAGCATLNAETIIVDDDDQRVAPGVIGEIVHRSPQVMLGYWNDPDKTAKAFKNGWFHSGDLAYMDDEGFIFVVDRKKDMIKTGGENVATREVEEAMYGHPAVAEVTVFGVPHPKWIEAVVAVVVPKQGVSVTPDELLAFGREHLAPYKAPKYVVLSDGLPKNASGKILKRELRQRYAGLAQG
ncbi:MAG TPA: acyl-CoA synthetase [Nevskiaceae bacterium]|nr:acyl-CoA synthetase [Nevskiaceae bacterium]